MQNILEALGEDGKRRAEMNKKLILILVLVFIAIMGNMCFAEELDLTVPQIGISLDSPETPNEYVDSIKILIMLTVITLVPSFLVMMTSFTRIIVVLSFLRSAMATQQTPPNQILIGLALFLTFFLMAPVYSTVIDDAVEPYLANEINQDEAIEIGSKPIKEFMLKQTREKDLALFLNLSGEEYPENGIDLSFTVLIPSFVISELKTAFQMGFMLFIPFIVIDLIVASILMSMGMFMLPPVMISLPFKLLLFVMVDGWYLVIKSIMESFI